MRQYALVDSSNMTLRPPFWTEFPLTTSGLMGQQNYSRYYNPMLYTGDPELAQYRTSSRPSRTNMVLRLQDRHRTGKTNYNNTSSRSLAEFSDDSSSESDYENSMSTTTSTIMQSVADSPSVYNHENDFPRSLSLDRKHPNIPGKHDSIEHCRKIVNRQKEDLKNKPFTGSRDVPHFTDSQRIRNIPITIERAGGTKPTSSSSSKPSILAEPRLYVDLTGNTANGGASIPVSRHSSTTGEDPADSNRTLAIPRPRRSPWSNKIDADDVIITSVTNGTLVRNPVPAVYANDDDVIISSVSPNLRERSQNMTDRDMPKNYRRVISSDGSKSLSSKVTDSKNDVVVTSVSTSDVMRHKLRYFEQIAEDILSGDMLSDESINLGQNLLHQQFPGIKGLEDTSLGVVFNFSVCREGWFVQVLHDFSCHWVCVSNIGCRTGEVNLYDSLNAGMVKPSLQKQITSIMVASSRSLRINVEPVQRQQNGTDCGVFALAFATSLLHGQDPSKVIYDVSQLRPHLLSCLKAGQMTPFPTLIDTGTGNEDRKLLNLVDRIQATTVTIGLVCSCRMPFDISDKSDDLIPCAKCNTFYHMKCENIPIETLEIDTHWRCAKCR